MQLTKIEISKYKSIAQPITIKFNDNLPLVFIGKNGSGKTNILEALEIIALANSNKYFGDSKTELKYKVFFKLSKEEINKLVPDVEYDEKNSEVIAYSVADGNGLKINRIESDYLVPELKKVVLDIRDTAVKLKDALEIYKKQLSKLFHDGYSKLPLTCYEIENNKNSTTSFYQLQYSVNYFLQEVERNIDTILKRFDDDKHTLSYLADKWIHFPNEKINFKLKYVKPSLPVFEQKFITINETAIKREITKINKATAKSCYEINDYIEKIKKQMELIINGLDFEYVKKEEVDNKYFKFLRKAQEIVAKKCLFLRNDNSDLLFRKQEYDHWRYGNEISLVDVYFKQVYQGNDKEEILESLSNNEKLTLSTDAIKEFESYINKNLPQFEKGMFEKITVRQDGNNNISIELHEKIGETINLNYTSSGRRWYFSFYFMKNILENGDMFIIDEPASMLHPSAQKEILSELEELSKNGIKVIYSTHSPYLIPNDWKSVDFVTMTENGTEISDISSNQELISQIQQIVGTDIFDVSNVISKYQNSDTYIITVNARKIVLETQRERNIRSQDMVCQEIGITKDTLKSWNENSKDFHCIGLENLLKVLKWANKRFEDVLD